MSKEHSAEKGCKICQNHPSFSPKLGKLNIKHHISPNLGGRLAAAELEVVSDMFPEGHTQEIMTSWGAVFGKDHYGKYGFEVCMAPASRDVLDDQAAGFEQGFRDDGVYVTEQCGGHVHTDARDFCINDICKLLQIYRHLEPALFKMLPAWRRKIGQCQRLDDYYMDFGLDQVKGEKSALAFKAKLDVEINKHRGRNILRGNWHERHCALNVSSWFSLGTVEFRMPPGLIRKVDISGFADVFTAIMNYAKDTKFFKIKLKGMLEPKQPTIADSVSALNQILELYIPSVLPWAKYQQQHASRLWTQIDGKRLTDIKVDL